MAEPTENPSTADLDTGSFPESAQAPAPHNLDILKSESGPGSDYDGGEKDTREKLKKTSIAAFEKTGQDESDGEDRVDEDETMHSEHSKVSGDSAGTGDASDNEDRGRSTKKRSFDDLQAEAHGVEEASALESPAMQYDQGHTRKKSRDATSHHESDEDSAISDTKSEEDIVEVTKLSDKTSELKDEERSSEEAREADQPMSGDVNGPKKKRSRDQFDQEDQKELHGSEESNGAIVKPPTGNVEDEAESAQATARRTTGEPEKKRHRDSSLDNLHADEQEGNAAKRLSTSGFANTSAVSPFGNLGASKSIFQTISQTENDKSKAQAQTSTSAFAPSGFAALSSSNKSPFGALGSNSKPTTAGFGFGGAPPSDAPAASGFGGLVAKSGFGGASPFATSGQSGFGKLGSTGFGGDGALTTFASRGSAVLGSSNKSGKPFGAPATKEGKENESGDEDDGGSDTGGDNERDHQDERFHAQKVSTGEEGETTLFVCKGKLMANTGKEWKERGLGTFKLNGTGFVLDHGDIEIDDDYESSERKARIIMRSEGVMRVILNAPVFKGMKFGKADGSIPDSKVIYFSCVEDGKLVPLVLKTGNNKYPLELYDKVQQVQRSL